MEEKSSGSSQGNPIYQNCPWGEELDLQDREYTCLGQQYNQPKHWQWQTYKKKSAMGIYKEKSNYIQLWIWHNWNQKAFVTAVKQTCFQTAKARHGFQLFD